MKVLQNKNKNRIEQSRFRYRVKKKKKKIKNQKGEEKNKKREIYRGRLLRGSTLNKASYNARLFFISNTTQ